MKIHSRGLHYWVTPGSGQKTGFYLDQAVRPKIVATHARGRRVFYFTITTIQADAFVELRRLKSAGEKFDLIILDPPKLAPSRGKIQAAERAYKDLNLNAMLLGIL